MEQRYKMYLTKNQFNNLAHYLKGHKEFALYDKIMRYATLVYLNQESRLCIGFFADELRKIAFMFCDELPESEETDYFEECAASSLEINTAAFLSGLANGSRQPGTGLGISPGSQYTLSAYVR